jgi:hypothetical protein
MKRLFISACALVAILAVAAPAFALDFGSISLSGYFRYRMWWLSQPDLDQSKDPTNRSYIDGRLRIDPTWKITDNVTLKQRFQMDMGLFEGPVVWRNQNTGTEDRQHLDILYAYAEIKLPVGLLQFGRIPISWGEGITDYPGQCPHDGIRLNIEYGPLTIVPYYYKNKEGSRDVLDDYDAYGIGLLYSAEWLEGGVDARYHQGYASTGNTVYFGGMDINRNSTKQQEFWVSPYIKAVFGPFIASTEWQLRFGTAWETATGTKVDDKAFENAKGVVRLQYNFLPFIVIWESGWAKGERATITKNTYQDAWHEDRDVDTILWEILEGRVQNGGFTRLEGTYEFSRKLKFVGQVEANWRDQTPVIDVGHYMGTELDLWIRYSPIPRFEFNFTGGYLFPGSYYKDMKDKGLATGGVTGDDQAFLLKGEFRVTF